VNDACNPTADLARKQYVVIVQCHIVKERCSGYLCERAFHHRTGGFAAYPADRQYRTLYLTCGGCCGRALHRKLTHLVSKAAASEGITRDDIVVQLSSCITTDNHHGPKCPHLDYLKTLVSRVGLHLREDTTISHAAEERRRQGIYEPRSSTTLPNL
jgi:predicted metal-binding protein